MDIVHGNVIDSSAADRIAGIYIDDADANDVDVVIIYYVPEGEDFDFPLAMKSMKDAETLLIRNSSGKKARNAVFSILSDEDYKFSTSKPLKIRLVTNYIPSMD